MRKTLAAILGTLLLSACSVIGVRSGTEESAYTVVDRLADKVEVRHYPARVVVTTEAAGDSAETARNAAFRRLFDYISGANTTRERIATTAPFEVQGRGEKIAMTVPVEIKEGSSTGRTSMRFFLPASFTLSTAPQPTDPAVSLAEVLAQTLAVLRFSGSPGDEATATRERELAAILDGSVWQTVGAPVGLFYDPPWTMPFLRRNEVAFPVVRR